jgi:crotonobetainyl-CoA:carnitine CoA-transferase CaiB-like acyl-CoA transferase
MIDLSGVRVLEFSIAWAGPLTGRYLADFGADVIKIEHPTSRGVGVSTGSTDGERDDGTGDDGTGDGGTDGTGTDGAATGWEWGSLPDPQVRAGVFPHATPGATWWNRMGLWNKMNRGKRSLCLDVKASPEAEQLFRRLVAQSDVVLNNYSPRGVRSLGIDHETLSAINPRIITMTMSGYGETGPMASHFSWGPILEAHSGFDEATGYRGGPPCRLGVAYPDAVGGVHGTFALLAALWERERTGAGLHVDLSQLETLCTLGGELFLATSVSGDAPPRRGNRSLSHAPQGVYPCRGDDAWVAVTVLDDEGWAGLVDLVDRDALRDPQLATVEGRFAAHDRLDEELAAWTSGLDAFTAAERLQSAGVAAAPAMTNRDLVGSGHLDDRGFMVSWDQPDNGTLTYPGFPIHYREMGVDLRPAPLLGQHNEEILTSLLGYRAEDTARLEAEGVIATRPPS